MKKSNVRQDRKAQWILYLDENGKLGIIEDDYLGISKMVKSRPGWEMLGFYYGEKIRAIKYANEVFLS